MKPDENKKDTWDKLSRLFVVLKSNVNKISTSETWYCLRR